jgi:hypothetical protein
LIVASTKLGVEVPENTARWIENLPCYLMERLKRSKLINLERSKEVSGKSSYLLTQSELLKRKEVEIERQVQDLWRLKEELAVLVSKAAIRSLEKFQKGFQDRNTLQNQASTLHKISQI